MNKFNLFLLSALAFFACANLQAQVTIGGATVPKTGAILDLNSIAKGGLVLSNVTLTRASAIPQSFPGVTSANYNTAAIKSRFTGAIVYHTGTPDIPAGIYCWNGRRWISPGGDDPSILYDAQMNDYNTGDFGIAGIWMTENLRTTDYTYVNGTPTPLVKKSTTSESNPEPEYTYPRVEGDWNSISENDRDSVFRAHEHYGLMYNWAAASGRTTAPNPATDVDGIGTTKPGTTRYRGVCPKDWHLPSDYEWIQLEQEIAANPQKYSSQKVAYTYAASDRDLDYIGGYRPDGGINSTDTEKTYWGRQMKSNNDNEENIVNSINPNGTSKPREEGGFDALLVGYVFRDGIAYGYGSNANFWTSSSYGSGDVTRYLGDGTGVVRDFDSKYNLRSVRCKKD
jgi:uncharacterized protein (TIGR02145 family)